MLCQECCAFLHCYPWQRFCLQRQAQGMVQEKVCELCCTWYAHVSHMLYKSAWVVKLLKYVVWSNLTRPCNQPFLAYMDVWHLPRSGLPQVNSPERDVQSFHWTSYAWWYGAKSVGGSFQHTLQKVSCSVQIIASYNLKATEGSHNGSAFSSDLLVFWLSHALRR